MSNLSFCKNQILTLLVITAALTTAATAQQASGPIVRCLDGAYYLVQCNASQLQVNDVVWIMRQGREVGRGKIVRSQSPYCSLLLESGEAQRYDVVFSSRPSSDQGPALPSFSGAGAGQPQSQRQSATVESRTKREEFFSGLEGGRVLDLGGGVITTTR